MISKCIQNKYIKRIKGVKDGNLTRDKYHFLIFLKCKCDEKIKRNKGKSTFVSFCYACRILCLTLFFAAFMKKEFTGTLHPIRLERISKKSDRQKVIFAFSSKEKRPKIFSKIIFIMRKNLYSVHFSRTDSVFRQKSWNIVFLNIHVLSCTRNSVFINNIMD